MQLTLLYGLLPLPCRIWAPVAPEQAGIRPAPKNVAGVGWTRPGKDDFGENLSYCNLLSTPAACNGTGPGQTAGTRIWSIFR